jgi:hypothetical protein
MKHAPELKREAIVPGDQVYRVALVPWQRPALDTVDPLTPVAWTAIILTFIIWLVA